MTQRPGGAPLRAPLSRELRCAAQAIEGLVAGRSLPRALDSVLGGAAGAGLPEPSRAAVRDAAYLACRQLGLVRELAHALNSRPPASAVAALQWVALSQLLDPIRAEGVIVDQAVAAARQLPRGAAIGGFINATLRRFLREREALLEAARRKPQGQWNFPEWWIALLRNERPAQWQAILEAGNQLPPMTLRVNRRRCSVDDYLAQLARTGHGARRVGLQAIVLDAPCAVEALPGWTEGLVSVQDAGAQLAAPLLDPQSGDRVLDACAAPGGKATHLLELADCRVTALDIGSDRLAAVRENLARLGFESPGSAARATVVAGDARDPARWWDGTPFDRILVDAPCTASGIVRRHPDIRWLRRRSDLATLARQQSEIVAALWPLLRPGGKLLYTTCSVFREEGESVINHFLAQQDGADRVDLQWAFEAGPAEPVAQLLPTAKRERDHDGFFYALLEKHP